MRRQPLAPAIEALWLTPLPAPEFERRVRVAMAELDGEELENLTELIRWFQRRYPTALERLAYARRKYRETTRAIEGPIVPAEGSETGRG